MSKILIIEDDSVLQKLYGHLFEQEGFDVSQAHNSHEAISMLQDPPPDIVLLDIMLPGGKNGYDVLAKIKSKKEWKNVPVIIITNLGPDEKQTALELGAVDHIVKVDITPNDLVTKVKSFLPARQDKEEEME